MKLISNSILAKDASGSAKLRPEEPEDMWHAYNIIRPGDLLTAAAVRKVITEGASSKTTEAATSRSSKRVHTTLTIRVLGLDFDPQVGQLHVSGRVAVENEHVILGGHHTLDLELHRDFTLQKEGWDSIAREELKKCTNPEARVALWAVVMQEGMAHICLVTEFQTILRQKVEVPVPKKRAGSTDHDKKIERFYQIVWDSLLRQINLDDPKPLLLASPGFTATSFQKYIKSQAVDSANKPLLQFISKIIVAHSASGHVHSLSEVLTSPAIISQLSDKNFARGSQLMDKFLEMVRKDDMRAWYGRKECQAAIAQGAVGRGGGVLMISNELFRSQEVEVRKHWVAVVDDVKEQGGEVIVLSSMHESGQRLGALGGLATILTWPIEDLDEGHVEGGEDLPEDGIGGDAHGIEGRTEPGFADNMDDFM